jgi:hypothetical protein
MATISVNIMGGLGNQMFQLATAYAYSKKYNGILKVNRKKLGGDTRPLYWDSVLKRFTRYLVDNLNVNELNKWHERASTEYIEISPPPNPGVYLDGYFQSEKYFGDENTKKEIKELFSPQEESLAYIKSKFNHLLENKERVIVIHARRTDYLTNQEIIMFHGPLTVYYYKEAIKRMCKIVENPIFLLSSDDSTYWSTIFNDIPEFNNSNTIILTDENEVDTLTLLQQFHYFVIANSTFSWWATWLAEESRKVIAPSKWFGPRGPSYYEDIYLSNWERI